MLHGFQRRLRPFKPARLAVFLFATMAFCSSSFSRPAVAQGCAQCLDSTRATPPAVQSAYRHAIYLLGGTAAALFVAGGLLLKSKN